MKIDKGKTLSPKRIDFEAKERAKLQEIIYEKYGGDEVRKRIKKLCNACRVSPCLLLPITTKGEDCPYYGHLK